MSTQRLRSVLVGCGLMLLGALGSGRLPHAYLFYGGDGVGKDAMALELARATVGRGGTVLNYFGVNSLLKNEGGKNS